MATNAELRAAAERLMDYDIPTNDDELDMIARHILATVPGDDGEPVTEEWLAPLCSHVSKLKNFWTIAELPDQETLRCVRWGNGFFRLRIGTVTVADIATRGDVRRACELMKVNLKGGAQ